jgi:nicotinate-nucleotide pyrophosphorylase
MPARHCAKSSADTRALLTAERAALNFLQLLSGTAT